MYAYAFPTGLLMYGILFVLYPHFLAYFVITRVAQADSGKVYSTPPIAA